MATKIMCALTPAALQARREGLLRSLIARAEHHAPTDDGYRLIFVASSDTLLALAAVIDAERRCCQWLQFDLSVQPEGGPFVLTLSGPSGAREFLDALFG